MTKRNLRDGCLKRLLVLCVVLSIGVLFAGFMASETDQQLTGFVVLAIALAVVPYVLVQAIRMFD